MSLHKYFVLSVLSRLQLCCLDSDRKEHCWPPRHATTNKGHLVWSMCVLVERSTERTLYHQQSTWHWVTDIQTVMSTPQHCDEGAVLSWPLCTDKPLGPSVTGMCCCGMSTKSIGQGLLSTLSTPPVSRPVLHTFRSACEQANQDREAMSIACRQQGCLHREAQYRWRPPHTHRPSEVVRWSTEKERAPSACFLRYRWE